jgi:ferric-dicitrate binding protein FerR (iron transport regulator)
MEYSVQLAELPREVVFPPHLQDRVRYDPQQQRLIYRGFMTKRAFDELASLSDAVTYHRALEQLFVLTAAEIAPPVTPARRRAVLVGATVALVAVLLAAIALWQWRYHRGHRPAGSETQITVATPAASS